MLRTYDPPVFREPTDEQWAAALWIERAGDLEAEAAELRACGLPIEIPALDSSSSLAHFQEQVETFAHEVVRPARSALRFFVERDLRRRHSPRPVRPARSARRARGRRGHRRANGTRAGPDGDEPQADGRAARIGGAR